MEKDSNLRRHRQQIYSLSPLATRESTHLAKRTISAHSAVYYITFFALMQVLFLMLPHLPPV